MTASSLLAVATSVLLRAPLLLRRDTPGDSRAGCPVGGSPQPNGARSAGACGRPAPRPRGRSRDGRMPAAARASADAHPGIHQPCEVLTARILPRDDRLVLLRP